MLLWASLLALIAVILGAFGAHGLRGVLSSAQLKSFETGVRYEFYHSFAIFIAVILRLVIPSVLLLVAARCFLVGTILFSGSIYLLTFSDQFDFPTHIIGPLTPVGGVFLIIGWLLVVVGVAKARP